jgi:hypothetical protein
MSDEQWKLINIPSIIPRIQLSEAFWCVAKI